MWVLSLIASECPAYVPSMEYLAIFWIAVGAALSIQHSTSSHSLQYGHEIIRVDPEFHGTGSQLTKISILDQKWKIIHSTEKRETETNLETHEVNPLTFVKEDKERLRRGVPPTSYEYPCYGCTESSPVKGGPLVIEPIPSETSDKSPATVYKPRGSNIDSSLSLGSKTEDGEIVELKAYQKTVGAGETVLAMDG